MSGTIKNDDPHLSKETTQRTTGEVQSGSGNDVQSQKESRSGLVAWFGGKGTGVTTQDHEYTAEDQIPRPSVFELNAIYTGTELGDERLTQHTLNPLAREAADYDVSVVDENREYGVGDTFDDQENSYDDLENNGELSPFMLSYLDNRVIALVREEMERKSHGTR